MKPIDSTGVYTPEEVKAALAGIDGTRQLSFRYERLDKNNQFIEEIDYVDSCTIENNALADIKRTAKLDILDTGTINYLQDRIKPYIRLHMPQDESYKDFVKTLNSDVWWTMDDPDQELIYATVRNAANDNTHNTFATAYNMLEGDVLYANISGSNDAALRNVLWAKIDITANNPVDIYAWMDIVKTVNGVATVVNKRTVYVQNGDTEDTLEVVPEAETPYGYQPPWYDIEQVFPELKTYYFKFETVTPTAPNTQVRLEWWRPRRVNDSSGNESHGLAMGTYFEFDGVVEDGGTSVTNSNHIQTIKKEFVTGPVFSGSVWTENNTGVQKNVFASWYESADNTSSPEHSDCEAWIDYTAGKVCLYAGFNQYQYDVRMEKFFDSSFLRKVEHFAWSVNVLEDRWIFWLDGIKHELDPVLNLGPGITRFDKDLIPETSIANRVILDPVNNGAAAKYDEFIWLHNAELSNFQVKEIYRLGTGAGQARRGYVEWPQGVFVLSSPKRTMQNGNTITREVEGYDQLVILKEDSFDYRYSVKKGVKYTDAVRSVLQSTRPVESIGLTDTMFVEEDDVQILTDTSATFKPLTTYSGASIDTDYTVTLGSLYMSAKVTVDPGAQFSFQIDPDTSDVDGTFFVGTGFQFNAGVLKAIIDGTEYASVTYNSTTHKHWRVRESGGFIFCDYSSNGTVWFNMAHAPLKHSLQTPARIQIVGSSAGTAPTPVLMAIDEFKLTVPRSVSHAITSSPSKLPTGMEWEPGTPKLTIINDLLSAINYESATYNEDGIFVGRPYISPALRTSSFIYATDSESVIMGDVDQTVDLFGVPNKWIIVVSEPDRPMLVGTYTNNDPHSPTSTVSRGRTIVDYRTEQSAPDQLTLDAQAARLAFSASQVYESIEFDTALMPIHQNADVYDLIIDDLGIQNKYSEQSWSMELKNGAAMSHKVRRVVNV